MSSKSTSLHPISPNMEVMKEQLGCFHENNHQATNRRVPQEVHQEKHSQEETIRSRMSDQIDFLDYTDSSIDEHERVTSSLELDEELNNQFNAFDMMNRDNVVSRANYPHEKMRKSTPIANSNSITEQDIEKIVSVVKTVTTKCLFPLIFDNYKCLI